MRREARHSSHIGAAQVSDKPKRWICYDEPDTTMFAVTGVMSVGRGAACGQRRSPQEKRGSQAFNTGPASRRKKRGTKTRSGSGREIRAAPSDFYPPPARPEARHSPPHHHHCPCHGDRLA